MSLCKIGEEPIISLNEDNKAARFANQHYAGVRDMVLREHHWNSAISRATLAASSTAPDWGFSNAFTLPADFLRLVRIEEPKNAWRLESDKILSNDSSMKIIYVFQLTDVSKMDALLQDTIATRLAAEMAVPVVQSQEMQKNLYLLYKDRLAEARHQDSMEAPVVRVEGYRWVDAHRGDGSFRNIDTTP